MAENVVEILITSRNKTGAGFKEAEDEAQAAGGRISGIFSKLGDNIGSHLKTSLGNALKGGSLFAGGAGLLSMAGPIGAAGAAMGAFGAIAIPILTKVTAAHTALLAAQQQYNKAVTSKQREAALKAEAAATAGLTSSEKGLMGPITQLQAMWGKLENQMAPIVVLVAKVATNLLQNLMPAFSSLAQVGGNALETILGYFGQFVRTPFFANVISQLGQLATQIAPLLGSTMTELLTVFLRLFVQAAPAGVQILNVLLPLFVRLLNDLEPVIVAVAKMVAVTLEWLQHTHLLLPVLALVAIAILAMEAPIAAVVIAVGVLIAVGVELGRHWHQIWTDIKNWVADALNWIRGHWPLVLGILTGPIGPAVLYIVQHFAAIKNFFAGVVHDIAAAWDWLAGHVESALAGMQAGINSVPVIGNIAQALGYATAGVVGAATGGVQGGLRLVGEYGPELVRIPSGSMMYPASQAAGMLGGGAGGGGATFVFDGSGLSGLDALFWTWFKNSVRVQGGDPAMFQRKVAFQ